MNTPMMKCGHAAQGQDTKTGKPVCVICIGLTPDAEIVMETPVLVGRKAKCVYYGKHGHHNEGPCRHTEDGICRCEEPSSSDLAFFEYKPNKEYDEFYCGCHSWD